jgi:adenylyltransferase/sulfurtransferase
MYLAAAGVGRIGLVDFDRVDLTNLQRQILFGTDQVGKAKVTCARERLLSINPEINVEIHDFSINSENALDLLESYDVIVDGSDNFPTRYLVNDASVILGKPNIYGSIFRFEGQVSVFNYQGGPDYRDLYPEPPPPGLVPNCAEAGVLGVLPGVIGAIQATETLKVLLDLGDTLSGRLLLYDALSMQFREVKLLKDSARPPITQLIDYQGFCGGPNTEAQTLFHKITVEELQSRMNEGWKPYVLDVRATHEAEIARLDFADSLQPHTQVAAIAAQLPKDRDIVVHCKRGGRSAMACATLGELGFTRLFNLEGGITAWSERIDSSIPKY